ncbi:MAG: hypothetical protein GX963_09975 [Bacteroidales bacterium]|nr:hypothetical protein [Bacteroidales bacterium]
MATYAHNISLERLRIIRELKKEGDRILFPMDLYDRVTGIISDMNRDYRIRDEKRIYSIRREKEGEHFYVIRIR